MGSLASRPSAPAPQPVVTQPAPQPAPAANETPSAEEQAAADEEAARDARRTSLLGRERSTYGTVLTGFRGLLDTNDNSRQRNTLLGE